MKRILLLMLLAGAFTYLSGQDKLIDSRDGNIYKTVTIQGLTWMAENLRYKVPDGTFSFDNDPKNIPIYGALYEWKTATRICPAGWHLPKGEEFQDLVSYNEQIDGWINKPSMQSSFGIQLAGMQDYEGTFSEMDESGYYWSATEYDKEHAEYFSYMILSETAVVDVSRKEDISDINGTEKSNKYSVRCVKN
jgi:uncharacterized protein (TIGR02145 family)